MHSLVEGLLIHNDIEADNGAAATHTGDTLDSLGYDGIMWVIDVGEMTASATLNASVFSDDASGMGTEVEIATSAITALTQAGGDGDEIVVIQILRPKKRYFRIKVVVAVDTVDFGVVSYRWRARREPVTQVAASEVIKLVSP